MPDTPSERGDDSLSPRSRFWSIAAVAVLALAGFAAAFTHVWNYDVFWHLACGEWMLRNGAVMGEDLFSIDPQPEWINVHWLFQVLVAALHAVGGFAGLSVLKALLATTMMLILALAYRRHVPPAWLVVSGLGMLLLASGRIRVRPEAVTLPLLVLTVVLVEQARRGAAARRLWWLVPMMLAWVNLHGLYILGLGVVWAALLGAWVDERLGRRLSGTLTTPRALAAAIAATLMCLATPWPLEAALHPLLLWSRVSGEAFYYTYGVAELAPTWQVLGAFKEFIVLAALAAVLMAVNWRRLPVAHGLWLAAFVGISLLALRNVGLSAPVLGVLIAWHGAAALARLRKWRPRSAVLGPPLAALAALATLALSAGYATEAIRRWGDSRLQFGAGLDNGNYPLGLGRWLAEIDVEGDVFTDNFGDASTLEYHLLRGRDEPRRRLYMDGRLEAHSLERFIGQNNIRQQLRTVPLAEQVELPPSIRFVVIGSRSTAALSALSHCPRFRLVRLDPVAACFEDTRWLARLPAGRRAEQAITDPLNLYDLVHNQADVGAPKGVEWPVPRWYAQNARPTRYETGMMLLSLGSPLEKPTAEPQPPIALHQELALRAQWYLSASVAAGIKPPHVAQAGLAEAYHQRSLLCDVEPSPYVPVDINSARALYLYGQLDLDDLGDQTKLTIALKGLVAIKDARQLDAGYAEIRRIMSRLPPPQRVNPPGLYIKLWSTVVEALGRSERELQLMEAAELAAGAPADDVVRRAHRLASSNVGLIERAVTELRAAADGSAKVQLTLGDLLLRQGKVDEARQAYARVSLPDEQRWEIQLREALCRWVEGGPSETRGFLSADFQTERSKVLQMYYTALCEFEVGHGRDVEIALRGLPRAMPPDGPPQNRYIQALAYRQVGELDAAAEVLKTIQTEDEPLRGLVDRALFDLGR